MAFNMLLNFIHCDQEKQKYAANDIFKRMKATKPNWKKKKNQRLLKLQEYV